MFKPDTNPRLHATRFAPTVVGINQATTFFGFCNTHDSALFRPLETYPFSFDPHQIALLGFRAFARELYLKDAHLDLNNHLERFASERPALQTLSRMERLIYTRLGLQNGRENLAREWRLFGRILKEKVLEDLKYFAVEFEHVPLYFASAAFAPEWDFEGNLLQDLGGRGVYHGIAFSAWATERNSVAVFCWNRSADSICSPWIDSLRRVPANRLANRILSMAFELCENIVLKRSWWDGLPEQEKRKLTQRVPSGLPSLERDRMALAEDSLTVLPQKLFRVEHG